MEPRQVVNSREEFENRKLSEKVEVTRWGNQRRQTQEDWNGRSTATTRKLVRRQTRRVRLGIDQGTKSRTSGASELAGK